MMADLTYLDSLSNKELHEQCLINGMPNIPVTDTTRQVMMARLNAKIKSHVCKTINFNELKSTQAEEVPSTSDVNQMTSRKNETCLYGAMAAGPSFNVAEISSVRTTRSQKVQSELATQTTPPTLAKTAILTTSLTYQEVPSHPLIADNTNVGHYIYKRRGAILYPQLTEFLGNEPIEMDSNNTEAHRPVIDSPYMKKIRDKLSAAGRPILSRPQLRRRLISELDNEEYADQQVSTPAVSSKHQLNVQQYLIIVILVILIASMYAMCCY
ncbi:LEM domain-containing protein Bocksbeutel-like [Scaptodrosophila lebanonensis]|uniref:LEM domain-containing protein Bocksbeutel-like n=1 Tax=Drosophila lebanonensis TaxID=7225 RepID=A0A6J2TI34_DROLE|nr:LEM domain-containing protein Bocksbeutel-like [Scaptodrosophila lebanonensis]XP_030374688.1 LEM domain-containing protein Bocksbeutel-like [Scaptodrosophila lebanonensis]